MSKLERIIDRLRKKSYDKHTGEENFVIKGYREDKDGRIYLILEPERNPDFVFDEEFETAKKFENAGKEEA